MQLIKINEAIIAEGILNEAKYSQVLDNIFKTYLVRISSNKNPSVLSKSAKPDKKFNSFSDAEKYAKDQTASTGIFKKSYSSYVAYIKCSKEDTDDFDAIKTNFISYINGKLTESGKEALDTLYANSLNDAKTSSSGKDIETKPAAKGMTQFEKNKLAAEQTEKENAEKEAAENYQKLLAKVKNLARQIAHFCPDTWVLIMKDKDEKQPYFLIKDPESDKAVKVDFNIADNVTYKNFAFIDKENNELKISHNTSTEDWDKDDVENKIVVNISKWNLSNINKRPETKTVTKEPETLKTELEDEEESPEEPVKEEPEQEIKSKPQQAETSQTKSTLKIINSKNGVLNVKKGDYAVGQDGKLRLVKVKDINYRTKPDGKAIRGLELPRTVRDALRKIGVMESLQINEAETEADQINNADKVKEVIAEKISEVEAKIDELNKNFTGVVDDKSEADKNTSLDELKKISDWVGGAKEAVDALVDKVFSSNSYKNLEAEKKAKVSDEITSLLIAPDNMFDNVSEKLQNIEDNAESWADIIKALQAINSELEDNNAITKLSDSVSKVVSDYDAALQQNQEKKAQNQDKLTSAKAIFGDSSKLPENIQKIINSESFKIEAEYYGADVEANPFLKFLSLLKSKYQSVWVAIDLAHYALIHDTVAEGGNYEKSISLKELMTGIDPTLNSKSLLYVADFYSKSTDDCRKYLKYRSALKRYLNATLSPISPDVKIDGFKIPSAGSQFSAEDLNSIFFNGDKLRDVDTIENIIENIFSEEGIKKSISLAPDAIIKDLAHEIECSVEDLSKNKDALKLAMSVLLNRVFYTIPLKLPELNAYMKNLGLSTEDLANASVKDSEAHWRSYFDTDNIDNKQVVTKIVNAVSPYLLEGSKNANNNK